MSPHEAVTLALVVPVVGAGAAVPAAAHSADGAHDDTRGHDNRAHGHLGPALA